MFRLRAFVVVMVVAPVLHGAETWHCIHPDGTEEWRDRPCPASATVRPRDPGVSAGTFNTIPSSRPPEALLERARRAADRRPGRRRSTASDSGADDTDARCAEREERLQAIDRRLRKGYSAGEGNELRAERRRVRRYLRDACG